VPTYGYHCSRCQAEFEVFQRMTDEPVADCPTCGSPGRRLFYPAGIVFKGSGFYKTDSRARATASGGQDKKAGPGKAASETSAGSAAGSAEAGSTTPATGGSDKKAATTSAPAAPP
jgi:putative FmdB family regulatory protein